MVNQAEKTFSESLRIAHDIYGYESLHDDVKRVYIRLADTAITQKNLLKAKYYLEQTKKMTSRSNTHGKDIVYMFHEFSSDLLIAQEDYKGALQCLYELIKVVGELSDKTMYLRDLGSVYLRIGKSKLFLKLFF